MDESGKVLEPIISKDTDDQSLDVRVSIDGFDDATETNFLKADA